jgi:tetratricopeptide (TPR) repeat protein|nr:tetratricopeptide repeat protein [Candidatus Krumholzibacteria bacterium]
MRQLATCTVLAGLWLLIMGSILGATPAAAWEEPAHWARIGTVQQWMDMDARFFRRLDDSRFVDRSQFRLDQVEHYEKTRLYGGELAAVSVEDFYALDSDQQAHRASLAQGKLVYVERYLQRVQTQIQRLRENLSSGWGDGVSDVTVLADCMARLGDAVGLDPSNPYSWHLQAYFTMCAGDETRSRQYLDGAEVALARVPADQLTEIRGRVALDQAWLARTRGDFEEALAQLDRAENHLGRHIETHLLRGLIYAQTGRPVEAGEIASRLRKVEVRRFPTSQRSSDFGPELEDPASWSTKPSDYMSAWITALSLLYEGDREHAASAFGTFNLNDMYRQGWRFWNEAGLIYEMTGRPQNALEAWNTARMSRPWLRNMIYKPYDLALGILTAHESRVPYMLGYDRHFISGSRLAYGASLVGRAGAAATPEEKQEWASRALDELAICRRTGIYPGQASVLRGHVYYLLGDIASSISELETAVLLLEKQGDDQIQLAVMKDLAALLHNSQNGNRPELLKQSGNSRGRWEPDAEPDRRRQQLASQLANHPGDDRLILEMARFDIRHDRPQEGRLLLEQHDRLASTNEAVSLKLEADRLLGRTELALNLLDRLDSGTADHLNQAGVWSLVGSICLEQGFPAQARRAWTHALELDPENQGLRMQLRVMGD